MLAAKFSMPHALAASAVLGTGGQDAFAAPLSTTRGSPAFGAALRLAPHPDVQAWPNDRPARVHWHFSDGATWTAERASARGGADRPFDDATLLAKIDANAAPVAGLSRLLLSVVRNSEALADKGWAQLIEDHLQEQ